MSISYPDGRWRTVCEDSHTTFPSRDAAARAERVLTLYQNRAAAATNASQDNA